MWHCRFSCSRRAHKYWNNQAEDGITYVNSTAYANAKTDFPGIERLFHGNVKPRLPSDEIISEWQRTIHNRSDSTNQSTPFTPRCGGRDVNARGGRGGRGRGSGRGNNKCECTDNISKICTSTYHCKAKENNLFDTTSESIYTMDNKDLHPNSYLNIVQIIKPDNSLIQSMALIDTGAPQGSYIGNWIRDHASVSSGEINQMICSPINNTCINMNDTVTLTLFIYDNFVCVRR